MDLVEVACISALIIRARKKKKRFWVHPLVNERLNKGQFCKIFGELNDYPEKFFQYYRMTKECFYELLKLVGPSITYKNTRFRDAISPEERLSVTLRYLATGNSFYSLHFEYLLGHTTIREIVVDTCKQLFSCLQPIYMPAERNEGEWKEIAKNFFAKTNFSNCVGAIDGRLVRIKNPDGAGSEFYSYKNFYAKILLAVCDIDYKFIAVDIGAHGANSDSCVLRNSIFGQKLINNQLNIPAPEKLPYDENGESMPFVLVGDEAFALSTQILRPYPRRNLNIKQKVYNYRLTRARRLIECTFGILCNKWRILHRAIDVNSEFCDGVIMACCLLHNFVRKTNSNNNYQDEEYDCPLQSCSSTRVRSSTNGMNIRDYFASYFTSPIGSVPWQYDCI